MNNNHIHIGFVAIFLAALSLTASRVNADAQTHTASKMATATNTFGIKLLQTLATKSSPSENVVISPVSIAQALDLAYVGANGTTRVQIGQALEAGGLTQAQFSEANLSLMSALNTADPQIKLRIANAVWADTDAPFAPTYKAECAKYYEATARTLDFRSPAAAATINSWVSEKTEGKIPTLVSPESVEGAASVLTNAVYFKGAWSSPFDADATSPAPFTLATGEQIQLAAMHKIGDFPVYADDHFQAISLPYGKRSVSMVIILPRAGTNANALLKTMTAESFDETVSKLISKQVRLQLPKFHIDFKSKLAEPLQSLGITDAFSRHADFSGMGAKPRYISDVIHKSMMDVDEQGTVAAAATGIVMRALAMPMPSEEVIVDHPFICAIRDSGTGALLFLGVINHPAELK